MTKSRSLPSNLSQLRNVEASAYTCYYQILCSNRYIVYIYGKRKNLLLSLFLFLTCVIFWKIKVTHVSIENSFIQFRKVYLKLHRLQI